MIKRYLELVAVLTITLAVLRVACGVDLGWSISPHPLWLPLALLIVHDGRTGLVAAVVGWFAIGALAMVGGEPVPWSEVLARLESGRELWVAVGLTCLGGISGLRRRQLRELEVSRRTSAMEAEQLRRESDVWAGIVGELRGKLLRMDLSVTFLRDISDRLASRDPETIARAILDFAMARTGAASGVLRIGRPGRWRLLVSVDSTDANDGALTSAMPPSQMPNDDGEVDLDKTIDTALALGRTVRKVDLKQPGPADADLATPLFEGGAGQPRHDREAGGQAEASPPGQGCIGMLVLREIPSDLLRTVDVDELAAIASWGASALVQAHARALLVGGEAAALWEELG